MRAWEILAYNRSIIQAYYLPDGIFAFWESERRLSS
jgi:hypothetical protein